MNQLVLKLNKYRLITKLEKENTLLRRKLEEIKNEYKVVSEKLAVAVTWIQEFQCEKEELNANFTKIIVERDELMIDLSKMKLELEETKFENERKSKDKNHVAAVKIPLTK